MRTFAPLLQAVVSLALISQLPLTSRAQEEDSEELSASDQEARDHFRAGRAYHAKGQFAEAAREFGEAYRLSNRTELLFNVFLAYRDAGLLPEAIHSLERYLDAEPNAENRTQLEARLENMKKLLAQPPAAARHTNAPQNAPPPKESGPSPVPWIVGGTGIALLGASIATGVLASKKHSKLEDNCSDDGTCPPSLKKDSDAGKRLAIATDVLWVTGAIGVGVGVTLLILQLKKKKPETRETPQTAFSCGPSGCSAVVQGTF